MTSDPTRIEISLDPTERRMRGTAVHGMTPFDCPILTRVVDGLYVGGCQTGLVLPAEVKHLVSLYPWERYTMHHEPVSELYVRLYDAGLPDIDLLRHLATHVSVCMDDGVTLVHCQAGLNRSGLVAASALVLRGYRPGEAIELLRATRSPAVLCNREFENWLRFHAWEALRGED